MQATLSSKICLISCSLIFTSFLVLQPSVMNIIPKSMVVACDLKVMILFKQTLLLLILTHPTYTWEDAIG